MSDEQTNLTALHIPSSIRSFVYLVGMLGFPIVVAAYVLVSVSDHLKSVETRLLQLENRISQRPMGRELSKDFTIYVTEALKSDLKSGLPALVDDIQLTLQNTSREETSRVVSIAQRQIENYVTVIVRKHQRFAERFPSTTGNLGSYFILSAAGEDISAGDTEADIASVTYKPFSAALVAMLVNNIAQFGNIPWHANDGVPQELRSLLGIEEATENRSGNKDENQGPQPIIDKNRFLLLSLQSIDTSTTLLRSQMLQRITKSSTEIVGNGS